MGKNTHLLHKKMAENSAGKASSSSKLAIACLLTAVVSYICLPFLAIIAIIMGIFAIRNIRQYKMKGEIVAWLGIMLSGIQILLLLVLMFLAPHFLGIKAEPISQAIHDMTRQEKQYFSSTLGKINQDSTVPFVNALLGQPYKTASYFSIVSKYYHCPRTLNSNCTIKIDYTKNKVMRVIWVDPNRFSYIKKYY